jgi:hypothetical protein
MENNSVSNILSDAQQTLKNLGGKEGIIFEVSLDKQTLINLALIMVGAGVVTVLTYHFVKIV